MCTKHLQTCTAGRWPELLELIYDEINMQVVKLIMKVFAALQNPNLLPLQTGWYLQLERTPSAVTLSCLCSKEQTNSSSSL